MHWLCEICGYVHDDDEAPEACPVCGAPASKFEQIDEENEQGLN